MSSSIAERAMEALSPEAWERARAVLCGKDPQGISMQLAAQAAGVPVAYLRYWIQRSSEKDPADPPWIHQIHVDAAQANIDVRDVLQDRLFRNAMIGVETPIVRQGKVVDRYHKPSEPALVKLLAARDDRYANRTKHEHDHTVRLDPSMRYRKLLGVFRLAEAEKRIAQEAELPELEHHEVA